MSGAGGLVKQGGGTFQLANYQGYSGTTVVSSGVLQLGPVTPLVPYTISNFAGGSGWSVNSVNNVGAGITGGTLLTVSVDNTSVGFQETSAYYNTQVPVGPFSATFVYQEATGFQYPTDGATFILQNSTSGITALGGSGNGLGYTGITPSAGIGVNPYFNYYNAHQQLWLNGGTVVSGSVSDWRSRTLATRSRSRSATTART